MRTSDRVKPAAGIARLAQEARVMVMRSGNPEDFDVDAWLSGWLRTPLPALGGERPLDKMDTLAGQDLVASLLAKAESGAYA